MSEANAPAPTADNAEAATDAEAVNAETQAETSETTTSETSGSSWKDSLPDDIKTSPTLDKFDTLEGLTKSYINLEKTLGSEKVPVPKSEEDWDKWYKAAGRPDAPEGYEFDKPENIPEGMEYSADMDKQFAGWAHAQGLNGKQAQGLREDLMKHLADGHSQALEQQSVRREEAEANLKAEFGRAYDQKMKEANTAMRKFAGAEFAAFLDETGLGDHPAMIKAFASVAKATMSENELVGEATEPTTKDLDDQIAEFQKKYAAELMDKTHPEHQLRVTQRSHLYDRRYDG